MTNNSPEFSFDLYPDLDRDLDDIYRRNLEQGVASGEMVATEALAATVNRQLGHDRRELLTEAETWARLELGDKSGDIFGVSNKWNYYCRKNGKGALGIDHAPLTFEEFEVNTPNFAEKIEKLYSAKQALTASGETTPEGINIGETMHLVAVPWAIMREHLDDFDTWVSYMRTNQNADYHSDYFNDALLSSIKSDSEEFMYRSLEEPTDSYRVVEYLNQRIKQDGDWGIILAQTSDEAGLERLVKGSPSDRTPDKLTDNGSTNLIVAGQKVDGMGIF